MNAEGPKCGMTFSHDEIIQALRELIYLGYARAWKLSFWGDPPKEYEGMPPLHDIIRYEAYFRITREGMVVDLADCPGWPFDDRSDLRKDWVPPSA
jgi:hypothetical protein